MARHEAPGRGGEGTDRQAPFYSLVVGASLVAALATSILRAAMGRPDWVSSWLVTISFLLFVSLLILGRYRYGRPLVRRREQVLAGARIALLFGLLLVVFQSGTPGLGLGMARPLELVLIFTGLVVFCVLAADPREYTTVQWLFVACFAIVAGIFFFHSVGIGEVSPRSRHAVWWGVLVGVNLLVVPRFVSLERFLWTLNRLAALLVLLALPIYVVGEYSLFGLQFTFHGSYEVPVFGREVRATRSLFVNRNTFAEVVFVGVVAGVAVAHRAIRRDGQRQVALPGLLLAVNVLGLALAYDRAMWVITPVAVGIYLASVTYGRRSIPLSVTAGGVLLVGGLLAVYLGILDTHTSNRFALWRAGVAAIADKPSLLGEGLIPPGRFIADYHDLGSPSTHNSYISIWIRTGFLGGVAYATLVAGSVLWGAFQYRDVDVAALALAAGFAAHQLFEAYTLFQSGIGSVLATLAIGFLLFGGQHDQRSRTADDGSSGSATSDPSAHTSGADYVGAEEGAPQRTSRSFD